MNTENIITLLKPLHKVPQLPRKPVEPKKPNEFLNEDTLKDIVYDIAGWTLQRVLDKVATLGITDLSTVSVTYYMDEDVSLVERVNSGERNPTFEAEMTSYQHQLAQYDADWTKYNEAVEEKERILKLNDEIREENELTKLITLAERRGYKISVVKDSEEESD